MQNRVLAVWNGLNEGDAVREVLACCGSQAWASELAVGRPYGSEEQLFKAADAIWRALGVEDWLEAFACHPRIGERPGTAHSSDRFEKWSSQEQAQTQIASDATLRAIADGNRQYEEQFGFTYIVCATGRSAEEMLAILEHRLSNDRAAELREAAEQQRQITQIRLRKWLAGPS